MTERYRKAKRLVMAALELSAERRSAYLDEACGDDEELRREVESLLHADTSRAAFVDSPPVRLLQERGDASSEPAIGPYRIVRELGQGGMGVVYLAHRTDEEFEHQVAIKVLQPDMAVDEIAARFRRERQILANLSHPNIARLLEGGRTADKRLYFLMEYVEGEPIDLYFTRRDLSTEDRLHLFLKVCAAVEHAHRNLVVHRDLKPSNILVTADGEPKLLDFGIAKLIQPELDTAASVTAARWRFMTFDYASPEQVLSKAITTASDVYSLGVLLYELLTGLKPYELAGRSEPEMMRIVTEEAPRKPSEAVQAQAADTGTTGTTRSLRRRLQGDLDTIVLKALRKEPERRYGSVAEFAQDIQRHLAGLPVQAQPDTWGYRAGKFVRRKKAVLALTSLLFLLILAFAVAMTVQVREKERQRLAAQQTAAFLTDLFESADLYAEDSQSITLQDVLKRGSTRILEDLSEEPEAKATLLETIATAHINLGATDQAEPLVLQAIDLRAKTSGTDSIEYATALDLKAHLRLEQQRPVHAETEARAALAVYRSPKALNHLAMALLNQEKLTDAEVIAQEAIALAQRVEPSNRAELADHHMGLGNILLAQNHLEEAGQQYQSAITLFTSTLGEDHPLSIRAVHNAAVLAERRGQRQEALRLYRQALAAKRRAFNSDHPTLAVTLTSLAIALMQSAEQLQESEELFQEAIAIAERRANGRPSLLLASFLNSLADNYRRQGRYEESKQLHREALGMRIELLGEIDPAVAGSHNNLGLLSLGTGEPEEARKHFQKALEILRQEGVENDPRMALLLHNIGLALRAQGNNREAEESFREGLEMFTRIFGEHHPLRATHLRSLASVLVPLGEYDEAEEHIREAITILETDLSSAPWLLADARSVLGEILVETGRDEAGRQHLSESYDILRRERGEDDDLTREARSRLRFASE
jgi:serine/threonine-protein kinase